MVFEFNNGWRKHPRLFTTAKDIKHMLPGGLWGVGLILTYIGLEYVGVIPKKQSHGHHDDHHSGDHSNKKH